MAKGGKKGKGKLSKAEKERLKKEEAERKLQEEEEARLRAEQEAREREERERQEREERRQFEEKERARHQAEIDELNIKITQNKEQLLELQLGRQKKAGWDRYMLCDGRPDPLCIKELNTYMNLWKEDVSEKPVQELLEECEVTVEIISEIQENLNQGIVPEDIKETMKEIVEKMRDLILNKLDQATFHLLKSPWDHTDQDTFNVIHSAKSKNITMCTWGNTAKNPRVKVIEFPEDGFTMEIPKHLALADVAVRVLYMKCDFLSEKSSTFYPRNPKIKIQEQDNGMEETKSEIPGDQEEAPADDTLTETAVSLDKAGVSSRKFSTNTVDTLRKEEGSRQEESKEDQDGEDKENTVEETEMEAEAVEMEEDYDFMDEDVVDLRSFSPLGPIIYIELLQLPPQPKNSKGWIIQQSVEPELKRIQYNAPVTPYGRSTSALSNGQSQEVPADESRGSAAPESNLTTPVGNTNTPIAITVRLPHETIVFEEPQLARWNYAGLHWRLDGFSDLSYNKETKEISFKTACFGPYAIMQDLYLNMPFQSWELRPLGLNKCILTIAAASIDLDVEIEGEQCKLAKPSDRHEIAHLIGKWTTPANLKTNLRAVGINVFAAEDGHKYVSICKKDSNLVESLYEQMALSSSAFAFSWSRWNTDNKKEDAVVVQATEWLKRRSLSEDDYSLYMASTRICCKLKMTEYDSVFDEAMAENTQMHPDLFHMLQDGASQDAKSLVQDTSYLFVDCVQKLLKGAEVLVYS